MLTMQVFDNGYIVYVQTDEKNRIIAINSSAFLDNNENWIQIDEGSGDKYHHAQNHYFDKPIYTDDGVPRYKLVGGNPIERTSEEIEADKPQSVSSSPTTEQLSTEIIAIKEQIDSIFDVLTTLAHNM